MREDLFLQFKRIDTNGYAHYDIYRSNDNKRQREQMGEAKIPLKGEAAKSHFKWF